MQTGEYEIMYRVEETHWWYCALHQLVFSKLGEYLPEWRQSRILDAGCGTGAILKQLGNPEKHAGVDLSPEAIAFCEKRGLKNVERADVTALPMPDASFDAVICSSVLYHQWVPDVGIALKELGRVLADDGLLFLNLPAFECLHSPHDEAVFTARRFTKGEVAQLLDRHGFEVRYASYWTTLLFPLAWAARYLKLSARGRDFEKSGGFSNAVCHRVMRLERFLLKRFSLPFGVALFCVARKKRR